MRAASRLFLRGRFGADGEIGLPFFLDRQSPVRAGCFNGFLLRFCYRSFAEPLLTKKEGEFYNKVMNE